MSNQNHDQLDAKTDLKFEISVSMDSRLFDVSFNDLMTEDDQLKTPMSLSFEEINPYIWN